MERKTVNGFNKLGYSVKSLINHKALLISILIALGLSLFYIWKNWSIFSLTSQHLYSDFIDPVVNIFTFLTALLIGFYNLYENWKDSLEKRLSIFYIYYYDSMEEIERSLIEIPSDKQDAKLKKEKYIQFLKSNELKEKTSYCVMICDEALLAHEGDIRNWGQQLGRQLAKANLDFHPFFKLGHKNEIVRIILDNKQKFTRQYMLYVFLESIPQVLVDINAGLLSTENYDDSPTNKIKKFKFIEIEQNEVVNYKEMRHFIDHLKLPTNVKEIEPEVI